MREKYIMPVEVCVSCKEAPLLLLVYKKFGKTAYDSNPLKCRDILTLEDASKSVVLLLLWLLQQPTLN